MLREIHINNYAVIERLSVEFRPGLNLLTGETGSGKSILVDALGLVLGGRTSPEVIRTGQDRASVTAVFQMEGAGSWTRWLQQYGLEGNEEREILLRREIQSGGKSRLLVNDQPATLSAVRNLARSLVDVHGQNEHVALLDRNVQLDLLDQFAGSQEWLGQVGRLFTRRRELEREIDELTRNEQERFRTVDVLRYQTEEIDRAHLDPGEDARLEDEKRALANVERLRAVVASGLSNLYEDEGSACARLSSVSKSLEELRRYDASAAPHIEPLASARAALEDLTAYFRGYLDKLEADPGRLEEVETRLAQLERMKRKYGVSIEEILSFRERTAEQLTKLENAGERHAGLAAELENACTEYARAAEALSKKRRQAASSLEKSVRQELAQLGMEKARFEVCFLGQCGPGGPSGTDEIELRISPNAGEELRPLAKIASGGELSRLMLALKTVVSEGFSEGPELRRNGGAAKQAPLAGDARARTRPRERRIAGFNGNRTFIFDEVDAGIGGRVAECVGLRLKRLSRSAQVLCVTHLPQIACFADHHFYVEKIERGGRTLTQVRPLSAEKDRAAELARMLSGSQITNDVLRHAETMLKQASRDSSRAGA